MTEENANGTLAERHDASRTTRPTTRLARFFGPWMMHAAILMLVGALLSDLREPKGMFVDPDLWWHVANGRLVEQTHAFIQVEPYSFTVAGQPWIDPEWLAGLIYWLGYKHLGLAGIVAVAGFGILGNVLLLYARSSRESRHPVVALWTTILGILVMAVNTSARMILFGYLALALEMLVLERARRGRDRTLWVLPPLFAVWINLHGSWVIGAAVLVLYIVCGWWKAEAGAFAQRAFTAEQRKRLLAVLAASVVLLFANPYGWRLMWSPFDMQFGQTLNLGTVQEWQPLNLSTFLGKMVLLTLLLMLGANALKPRKWTVFELALFLFAWCEALAHVRFTFLAAVLTLPMITGDVARAFFPKPRAAQSMPLVNGLLGAGVLVLVIFGIVPRNAKLAEHFAEEMPLKTIAMLRPEWRTLNQDTYGGWMDFNGKPTFIDSRFDTFEHHGVMRDYLDIVRLHDSLGLMEKYRIDHVLTEDDAPIAYLLEHTQGWTPMARESMGPHACVLFARTASAPGH